MFSTSLQAVNCRRITIKNLAIAVLIKFIIEIVFMPFKNLNIYALAIANTVCYLVVMMLNYIEIEKKFVVNVGYVFVAKLLVSNFIMLVSVVKIFELGESSVNIILGFVVGVVVYLCSIVRLKILNKKDVAIIKYKIQ